MSRPLLISVSSRPPAHGGRPRELVAVLADPGGLLLLNWLLGSLLVSAVRPAVSYTFFLGQVNANNVQTVTSTGDAIQGTFRHQVAYPPGSSDARQVEQFNTQRPTFADDKSRQGRLGYDRRPGPGRRRPPDRLGRCRPQRPRLYKPAPAEPGGGGLRPLAAAPGAYVFDN